MSVVRVVMWDVGVHGLEVVVVVSLLVIVDQSCAVVIHRPMGVGGGDFRCSQINSTTKYCSCQHSNQY